MWYWICPVHPSDPPSTLLLPSSVTCRQTSVGKINGLPSFQFSCRTSEEAQQETDGWEDSTAVRLGSLFPTRLPEESLLAFSTQVTRFWQPFSPLALWFPYTFINSSVTKLPSVYPGCHLFPARSLTDRPTNVFSSFYSFVFIGWFVCPTSATTYSHRTPSNFGSFYFYVDRALPF